MCHFGQAVGDHRSTQECDLLSIHLKDCAKHKDLIRGFKLHSDIIKNGLLGQGVSIASSLVSLYAKCGAPAKAQHVLNELPVQSVLSWNSLISGHAQNGHGELAIECFERMQHEGIFPDAVTYACVLKACANTQAVEKGGNFHAEIARKGFLQNDVVLCNALLDMYGKCGALKMAEQVFKELPCRNVISWTALVGSFCQCGNGEKALCILQRMQEESFPPDRVSLLCMLQAAGTIRAADRGRRIHAIVSSDRVLQIDLALGDALVDMYIKCGALHDAYTAFCELPCRSMFSWTSLISGYCHCGFGEEALKCFQQMKDEGFLPDAITYACILKTCGDIGAAEEGEQIHQQLVNKILLGKDRVLSTALIYMYVKCGELTKAQHVFDGLPHKDVTTWNVLIAGYCQHGNNEKGLQIFHQMAQEGFCPNAVSIAHALKACSGLRKMNFGLEIHGEIARKGLLGKENILGSALVDMYATCGALEKAKEIFSRLGYQDSVSWTVLIAAHCRHGYFEEALELFDKMEEGGFSPDAVTFSCILKACECVGAVEEGEFYFKSMINSYLIVPTLDDHTCMIALFGHAGHFGKTIAVINRMPSIDHLPAWAALLSACRKWGNVKLGKIAFKHVVRLDREPLVAYLCLSCIYAVAGMREDALRMLIEAQHLFDKCLVRDAVSWNALISALYECECYEKAIMSYELMKQEGLVPNTITFLCILKVCACETACETGKAVHHDLRRVEKTLEEGNVLGTALLDMYAKCGEFDEAKQVFERLKYRNVAAWNALISGYCQHGRCEEVMVCSERMKYEGVPHDLMTFSCILKACGTMGAVVEGEAIQAEVCKRGLFHEDIVLGNASVDMYMKCGLLSKAELAFNELPHRNIVSWNVLIAGYCKEQDESNVMRLYEQMQSSGISPDAVTLVCILKACGNIGAIDKGKEVHIEIAREGVSGTITILGSALVNMYVNCGALHTAQEAFNKLPHQDLASWTALIAGYCQNGFGEQSLKHFGQMIHEGVAPDALTLTCVLKACSSLGAAEKGRMYMEKITRNYGIVPVLEHFTCMVHLLGHTGNFDEALTNIVNLSCDHYLPVWYSILSNSLQAGNERLGRLAFEHAVRLDRESAVPYVFMRNLYASAAIHKSTVDAES